jgi:hypothetical protein
VLYNFGRIENIDIDQLKRLVKSISRFLPASDAAETQALLYKIVAGSLNGSAAAPLVVFTLFPNYGKCLALTS